MHLYKITEIYHVEDLFLWRFYYSISDGFWTYGIDFDSPFAVLVDTSGYQILFVAILAHKE